MIAFYFGLPFDWGVFSFVLVLGILIALMAWVLSMGRPGPAGNIGRRY